MLSITLLAGCSELQVIGNSAIRELKSDGMSVEMISYNYHQKLAAKERVLGVMMAKADTGKVITDGKLLNDGKKSRIAKSKRVKGLWEKNAQ